MLYNILVRIKYLALAFTLTLLATALIYNLAVINKQKGNSSIKEIEMIVKNISNCSHQGTGQEKDTCYHANLNKNLSLKDIENVVISINNLRKTDQELNIACHQITHILGVQAYQKHQAASLISGYKTCQEGYYHGLMSEVINSTDNYLEKLNAFCSNSYLETGNKEDWERNICFHGIGHALGNNAVPGENKTFYKLLVEDCNKMAQDDLRAATCFDGGLAEYHIKSSMGEVDCVSLPKKYIKTCYRILYHFAFAKELSQTNNLEEMVAKFPTFDQTCLAADQSYQYKYEKLLGCKGALSMSFLTNVLSVSLNGQPPIFATLDKEQLSSYYNKVCGEVEKQECLNLFIDYTNNINSANPVKRLT